MLKTMIMFFSCSTIGESHEWGTSPKCKAALGYGLVLDPLCLECLDPASLPILSPYAPIFGNALTQGF